MLHAEHEVGVVARRTVAAHHQIGVVAGFRLQDGEALAAEDQLRRARIDVADEVHIAGKQRVDARPDIRNAKELDLVELRS